MSDTKDLVKPKRWEENEVPPCTVSYFFTLLDVNQELRYCCHGKKFHGKFSELSRQWNSDKYQQFRKEWSENYKEQKPLCLGCPHHEENKQWDKVIREYLKSHEDEA